MKQWLRRLLAGVGSVAMVVAMLGLISVPVGRAAIGTETIVAALRRSLKRCWSAAASVAVVTVLFVTMLSSTAMGATSSWGPGGMEVCSWPGGAYFDEYGAVTWTPYFDAFKITAAGEYVGNGSNQGGVSGDAGVSGVGFVGFTAYEGSYGPVETGTLGVIPGTSGQLQFAESWPCGYNTTMFGPTVSTLSSPGTLSLGSFSGIASNQVQVTLNSNIYNEGNAATWTLTQQQLNASGGIVATNTYSLSTPSAGSTTWTSSNQQPDYAYQYTASVTLGSTSYSTSPVLFPIAGAPTVGSITPTGATISWPTVYGVSSYVAGYWPAGTGSWPGTDETTSGTSWGVSGLTPNSEYCTADAVNAPLNGGTGWAQGGPCFWTLANPPSGVSLSFSGSTASVSWSANGNPSGTHYQVEVLNASNALVAGPSTVTGTSASFAGVCGGSVYAQVQAENQAGVWTSWVASSSVAAPACVAVTIGPPTGWSPSNPYQLNVTAWNVFASAGTIDIYQERLGPSGAQVAFSSCPSTSQYTSTYDTVSSITLSGGDCVYAMPIGANSSTALTTFDQQVGGAGFVYRYDAVENGQTSNSVLFANGPTFYVHRRTRGLFITWPDEGNGTQYEVFGGPGSSGCGGGTSGDFNSGVLAAGTTQWAVGGLTPNTEYQVCMWAEIPGQPVTSGGYLPNWWVSGGNANSLGMWYTLPDVPGEATAGGLLAAYYDVPSLASNTGPSEQVFGTNADYTAVQGPIDFSISCNCTSSWPYLGNGGAMPTSSAGSGTATDFAAKYLGWVYAPSAGSYTFGCMADDACQVWVDGQPVVQAMTGSGSSPNYYGNCNACGTPTGTITLAAGTWYPLEIDYTQQGGGAQVHFTWTPPSGTSAPVPASDLAYPSLSGAPGGSAGNLTLSWAANGNPAGTGYTVSQYALSASGSVTASNTLCAGTTADSCTTTNLTGGTVSEYYVQATSGDGFSTPAATEPGGGGYMWADAPQATVSVDSSGSIALSWPSLGNGAQYAAIWNTSNTGSGASNSGGLGSATSFTITGLQPNTAYYLWIDAWIPEPSGVGDNTCAGGSGGGCFWYGAATYPAWTLADVPTSLVLNGASDSLSLSWGTDGNPSGTTYDWTVTAEGGSSAAQSGSTSNLDATAAGLVCQSNYTAAVEAVNGAGVATAAETATGETGTCSPPPKVALEIDNGLAQTATTGVTLDIQATDASYAQSQLQMRFSNDGSAWSAWQPYAATASWTLTGAPGPNTVYAEVQDPQDGLGSAIATISYDSSLSSVTSGSGTACTYDGTSATCTKSPIVTATFTVPSGSVSMETSLDGTTWSQPQDAKTSVSLVLPTGDGLKAVFARYFNQDNLATPEGPDYFVLDTTPPVIQSVAWLNGAAVTQSGSATLVVQASDNITPASALQVSVSGAATWSGTLPSNGQIPLAVTGSGYVTVDVKVADQAGNTATARTGIYNS